VTINVYEPKVKHHWVPSGSWIQIENGTGCGDVNDEAQNKSCTDHSRPGFVQDPKTKKLTVEYGNRILAKFSIQLHEGNGQLYKVGWICSGSNRLRKFSTNGHFASEAYGRVAFIRDILIVNENKKLVNPNPVKAYAGS
uniref:Uncharacterized protein n=1 Tax=Oryza nivara TaxID=4536 RepID=A0A0E0HCT8_ORYNI